MRFPIEHYLVPEYRREVPAGFARLDATIINSVPFTMTLNQDYALILAVPSGLGNTWREADPTTLISSAQEQASPTAPAAPAWRPLLPLTLQVQRAGVRVAVLPLLLGMTQIAPRGDASFAALELIVLDWALYAGNLRGRGDFGSRLTLAWRVLGAADQFEPPPLHPEVAARYRYFMSLLERFSDQGAIDNWSGAEDGLLWSYLQAL